MRKKMDTRIYVAAHKVFDVPKEKIYIPLHVGHAGKEELGYQGDDTGDHISYKNANYCELTGIYWMWKNVNCDYIGLCHYRRYFVKDGQLLTQAYVENILQQYDLILGNSSISPHGSVESHYDHQHYHKDLVTCRKVLTGICPEYVAAFDVCMQSNLMNLGNMMIAKKQIFDDYCAWLFAVLEEVEKRTDLSTYDTYQARLYGFLSERLLRVWVMMQELRVREEMIVQV